MKSNIYTRKGDSGMTSLATGERVRKDSLRLECYGTIDELNSHLGLLLAEVEEEAARQRLVGIQNTLFVIGAVLASPGRNDTPCPITGNTIERLEHDIDATAEGLPAWRGFTLPGGCRAAAQAHVCRTVCRRAERRMLALQAVEDVQPQLLAYINRLSDFLYTLACNLNRISGTEEILWDKTIVV